MIFIGEIFDATVTLMSTKAENVQIRSSYNLSGISFTPKQIAESIKKQIPEFEISYTPDFRQQIADSWPSSIDDTEAREQWNWKHQYDLDGITKDMLKNLSK